MFLQRLLVDREVALFDGTLFKTTEEFEACLGLP
jgi:hypothetical protein